MHTRRIFVSCTLLILLICASFISKAQSQSFLLNNLAKVEIDESAVKEAAQAFSTNHDAKVVIYTVVSGNANDFSTRLKADNYGASFGDKVKADVIAIYFATEERYSEIRWGSDFDFDGADVRSNALNPALRNKDFTRAINEALGEIDGQLSNPMRGIQSFMGSICAKPELLFIIGFFVIGFFLKQAGLISLDGADSSDDSSWSSGRSNSGSSRSSSDRSSSSRSGGGSSGGSWDD